MESQSQPEGTASVRSIRLRGGCGATLEMSPGPGCVDFRVTAGGWSLCWWRGWQEGYTAGGELDIVGTGKLLVRAVWEGQKSYFLGQETRAGKKAVREELVPWGCSVMWRRGIGCRGPRNGRGSL